MQQNSSSLDEIKKDPSDLWKFSYNEFNQNNCQKTDVKEILKGKH